MKISLNDLDFIDGKYSYTFTPSEDLSSIQLESDCLGDLKLNHIQVENNSTATEFVSPMVYDEPISGVFKYIDELRLEMTDVDNSNLWSSIRLNSKQMLMQYHENEFKTALNQTAKDLTAMLEDKDNLARLVMTAQRFTNLMASRDGSIKSQLDQLASGFNRTVKDYQSETETRLSQLSNGFNQTVTDYKNGTNSQITQLSDLINEKVTKSDVETIIGHSGDNIWLQIKDRVQTTASGSKMTGEEIVTAINLATGYAKIQSDKIILDGNTYMTNAFAKNLLTNKLTANDVSAFSATFNKVIANNLDVNNLTGNFAQFIQALFNGKNSKVKIDGSGMQVLRNDGSYSTAFGDNGISIYRSGQHTGSIESLNATDKTGPYVGMKSMSLTAQPDSYLSLSYYSLGDETYYRGLSLGGDGRLRVWRPFNIEGSSRGWEMTSITWPRYGSDERQDGTSFKDLYTGRYFGIGDDGDFWMPMNDGHYINATRLYDDIENLRTDVKYLKSELKNISDRSSNWSGGGYTPSPEPWKPTPTPKPKPTYDSNISTGDRVKLKSSVTYYYDNDDRAVRIPNYSNSGQPIKNGTFTVARIRPWSHQVNGYYELYIGQWQIAWAGKNDIYKV